MTTYRDRVRETTATTGLADYALGGPVAGYQGFLAAFGAVGGVFYCVTDGADWEVGSGTLSAGPDTLTRDTILDSSNGGLAVVWSAGAKRIFHVIPAAQAELLGVGVPGTPGADGADGAVWRTGAGAPNNAVGADGDFYLRSSNGAVYERAGGVYGVVANLTGPAGAYGAAGADGTNGTDGADGTNGAPGAPGAVWRSGAGIPDNALGVDGDFYLRTANGDVFQRAAGAYTVVANIEGPQGPAGADGAPGADGANGADGTGGTLIGVQRITATGAGTYTPTAGTTHFVARLVGGGGGGGSAASAGAGSGAAGGGGGAGGYVEKAFLAPIGASYPYVIGAKGTGGAAASPTPNPGTDGGASSFDTPSMIANGGVGGKGAAIANTAAGMIYQGGAGGSASMTGTTGFAKSGGRGGNGFFYDAPGPFRAQAGDGGSNPLGAGGQGPWTQATGTASVGANGDGYGAGGSGAAQVETSVDKKGGDGTDGALLIFEYS